MSGQLFIVATPIGNLGDITPRALEVLKSVDLVLAEDTRVTGNLLHHFGITTPMKSYHQHTGAFRVEEIRELLEAGKLIALVSDAGTPGISDPGNMLIAELTRHDKTVVILPVPGPSAVAAALSVSGFPTEKFIFLGFPPHKNKRQKYFKEVAASEYTTVFYESNHRIMKCFADLAEVLSPERQICVCRELTKQFESVYRGTIQEIMAMNIPEKGEFVVVINQP
jgi:16S rRNA (cytidine1402-2'-O)-methyltransferase